MILIDTSVWIDHIRRSQTEVVTALKAGQVMTHPFVIDEIALGRIHPRDVVLRSLFQLPRAVVASDDEVCEMIERFSLGGRGIGFVDAHLVAACHLTSGSRLLTRDKRLEAVAREFDLVSED